MYDFLLAAIEFGNDVNNCRYCVIWYLYNKQLHNVLFLVVINEHQNQRGVKKLQYSVCKVHVFSCSR